jgi:Mrp family chromosome partitioning ATPase
MEMSTSLNHEWNMNVPEQAFISAYNDEPQIPVEAPAPHPSPGSSPIETRARWYRIDARRPRAPMPAPHVDLAPSNPEAVIPESSVEVSVWDVQAELPSDNFLVSANILLLPESEAGERTPAPEPNDTSEAEAAVTPSATEVGEVPVAEQETPSETSDVDPADDDTAEATNNSCSEADEQPSVPPKARTQDFKPVWEVDRFAWPGDTSELYDAEANYFRHAGEKLRDACGEGLRVLAITSAKSQEGCTTLAMCLARAAAESGLKVVLLDANLARPRLATRLGIKFPHGWQAAVAGDVPLGETAIASLQDGIVLLPLNERTDDAEPSLDDARVTGMISTIASGVDLVVIDGGNVGENPAKCFEGGSACPIDAMIVVRNVLQTSQEETLAVATHFKERGIAAVGIAENFTQSKNGVTKAAA